jgi:hypothetical protein
LRSPLHASNAQVCVYVCVLACTLPSASARSCHCATPTPAAAPALRSLLHYRN